MSGVAPGLGARPAIAARGDVRGAWRRLQERPGVVAYLGASVTAQQDGFRPRLQGRLEEVFASPRMITAGIGGVGSMAGLFLMDDLVLRHHPDLCLVEFLTADMIGYTPDALITDAVHGIAEKLLSAGCTPVFVYLNRGDLDPARRDRILEMWEGVAEALDVASIDVAPVMGEAGSPQLAAVLQDPVHLASGGADLVAEAIFSGLTELSSTEAPEPRRTARRARFGQTLVRPASLADVRDPHAARQRHFRLVFSYIEIGRETCFETKMHEELVGLVVVVGPGVGVIRVSDGSSAFELDLWDQWCTYDRLSAVVFPRPFAGGERITIKPVRASPAAPDQSSPPRLSVIGFMAVP